MLDVDIHTPITDERRDEVIDSIAEKVVRRRLEMPAVLFLDMHKPLSFIASQSLLVAMPLLGMMFGAQPVADLSKLLAERENVEKLIMRIEEMSANGNEKQEQA
jgi:hypothetical protein